MSAFTLDCLRLNCMEIFHYLANQLKGTPYLRITIGKLTKIKRVVLFSTTLIFSLISYYQAPITIVFGAIFNSSVRFHQNDAPSLITQESVDHAVLEADRHEPAFDNPLSFEHPHYISSSTPDKKYMEKVYKIATGGFKELPITQKVLEIYKMGQRGEWERPESMNDAWLLSKNSSRKWFPYKYFIRSTLIGKKRINFLKRRTELNLV